MYIYSNPLLRANVMLKTLLSTSDTGDESEALIRLPNRSAELSPWLNKIHQGDCIDLMNKMPLCSVDLIVTSPPYNIKNSTGNGLRNGSGGKWPNAKLIKGYDRHNDAAG